MSVSDLCLCSMSFCVFLCVQCIYVYSIWLHTRLSVCLRLSVCCMLGCVRECVLYILCLSVCSLPLKSTVPLLLVFAAVFEDFAIWFFRQFFSLMLFFLNSRPFFAVVFTLIKLSGLEVSHQPPPEIHSKTQTDTGNQAQTINHSIRVADPERLEAEIRIPLFLYC